MLKQYSSYSKSYIGSMVKEEVAKSVIIFSPSIENADNDIALIALLDILFCMHMLFCLHILFC